MTLAKFNDIGSSSYKLDALLLWYAAHVDNMQLCVYTVHAKRTAT